MVGLPSKVLFNAKYAVNGKDTALLLEGAKKAMCVEQYDYPAMAVLSSHGFNLEWLKRFTIRKLVLVPDPDALHLWRKLGQQIANEGFTVYVAEFSVKPDDLFIDGGSKADFDRYLGYARRIH